MSLKTKKWLEKQGYFISKSVVAEGEASGHVMVKFHSGQIGIDHLARKLEAPDVGSALLLVEDMNDSDLSSLISHLARLALGLEVFSCQGILVVPNLEPLKEDLEEIMEVFRWDIRERISVIDFKEVNKNS